MIHSANTPRIEKIWLEPEILSKVESNVSRLEVIPTIGGLDAEASDSMWHDLTLGRETLEIMGRGRFAQMRYREHTLGFREGGQDVLIYGVELPYNEWGKM